MANISSAHGTLVLSGWGNDNSWTQEDIDAFIPVLDCWEFHGEYGIQSYDHRPTVDNPTTHFYGCGHWSFSDTLECLDAWTRDWIKNPGNSRHPLSQEQYERFLMLIKKHDLSILVEFWDEEDGVGFDIREVGRLFPGSSGNKRKLEYSTIFQQSRKGKKDFVFRKDILIKYQGTGGDVIIPEGVTRISPKAFQYCFDLTSVTIPTGVTKIGDEAFFNCRGLTSVTIPEGVKEIGWRAFSECTGLASVTIPESVTEIRSLAFYGCANLTSVTIPESVTEIGNYIFSSCTGLTGVTVLGRLEKLDESIFYKSRPVLITPHIPISGFSAGDRPGAICGFAKLYFDNTEMDEEIRAGYLKYIKGQKKKLYPLAVRHEELLRLMLAEKMLSRKDVDILLAECDNQNNAAAKDAVQDYINTL